MLELGLMTSIQHIYDFEKCKFEYHELESLISSFENLYKSFPLLPIILKQMLIIDQKKRFSFKKLRKALPNWDELKTQFFRDEELITDITFKFQKTSQNNSKKRFSKLSIPNIVSSENLKKMEYIPSSFSNYVTTSSKRTNRVTSKRTSKTNNPLQIRITPEKIKKEEHLDPLSKPGNQIEDGHQDNTFYSSRNGNMTRRGGSTHVQSHKIIHSDKYINTNQTYYKSKRSIEYTQRGTNNTTSRLSNQRNTHSGSINQSMVKSELKGMSEIDRISQNLFKITKHSKHPSTKLSSKSRVIHMSQGPRKNNMNTSQNYQERPTKVSIRNRQSRPSSMNPTNIFEDTRINTRKSSKPFFRSQISPSQKTQSIRIYRRSYNSYQNGSKQTHPLYKQVKLSDTLESNLKKSSSSHPNQGLGQKIIKNIQGMFVRKEVRDQKKMSYKEIMKMRETSQLWEDDDSVNHRGPQECIMDVQFTQGNSQYSSRQARSNRSNMQKNMVLGERSSHNIINKVVYRVPRMSEKKPKPMKGSIEKGLNNVNQSANVKIFDSNSELVNNEFLPKRLSIKRTSGSTNRQIVDRKVKTSVDPIIVFEKKGKRVVNKISFNRKKREERSSSVFSNLKKKKVTNENEQNNSRVSSYSKRKNRFHEKSSEKKPRKSSKIKIKYSKLIKPIKRLRLPPLKPKSINKENLKINPIPYKFEKNRNVIGLSPLSSRRSNRKLRSDRASSIQFKITNSNIGDVSIESQDSVICDISSFKDLDPYNNEHHNKKYNSVNMTDNKVMNENNTKYTESRVRYDTENTNHTRKLKFSKKLDRLNMDDFSSKKSNRIEEKKMSSRNEMFLFDTNGKLVREELFGNIQSGTSESDWGRNSKKFMNALEKFLKQKHI